MEFLKKMKSRETTEMILKTIAAVVLGLILIILMEGMIFGIYMNKIEENNATQYSPSQCVAYCEKVENDKYKVYLENEVSGEISVKLLTDSKEDILNDGYIKVVWHAPTPFDVSISGVHYVVMSVFIVAILGLYGWRFYKLNKEYVNFEKKYKKTGKIF